MEWQEPTGKTRPPQSYPFVTDARHIIAGSILDGTSLTDWPLAQKTHDIIDGYRRIGTGVSTVFATNCRH
jgi:hypothetical protein